MLIRLIAILVALVALTALYLTAALKWSYSSGERAGWVQKLSKKGWVCKTWEGELAMVSLPGSTPDKFYFTIFDDEIAHQLSKAMGKRVSLHYEEKVGLPTSCFGDTRYYVNAVSVSDEIPLAPGVMVPNAQQAPARPASASLPAALSPAAAASASLPALPAASQ